MCGSAATEHGQFLLPVTFILILLHNCSVSAHNLLINVSIPVDRVLCSDYE